MLEITKIIKELRADEMLLITHDVENNMINIRAEKIIEGERFGVCNRIPMATMNMVMPEIQKEMIKECMNNALERLRASERNS